MREWIVGLEKASAEKGEGLDSQRWFELDGGVNAVPDELRDLYESMDGATLPPDVTLIHFFSDDRGPGVVERSVDGPGWVFGEKGGGLLFTARKRDLDPTSLPEWAQFLSEEEWMFALRTEANELRFYRSLEQMLTRLVPPAQTEDFGEVTYVRALTAVQGALGGLNHELDEEPEAAEEVELAPPQPKKAPVRKAKKAPAKKPARPAKKVSAKKANKPAKKASAKKANKPAKKISAKRANKPAKKVKKVQPKKGKKAATKKKAAKRATKKPAKKK